MATVEIRRPGKWARTAHTLLLFSATVLLLTITTCVIALYPLAHIGLVKADALLDESARTVIDAKKLVKQASATESDQEKYLQEWDGKVSRTFDSANAALASLQNTSNHLTADEDALTAASVQTLHSADQTVASLEPVSKSLSNSIDQLSVAVVDLQKIETDPNIPRTLAATATAAENVSATAANLDATTSDVKVAVHTYLHPSWATRMANWTIEGVHALGGWF